MPATKRSYVIPGDTLPNGALVVAAKKWLNEPTGRIVLCLWNSEYVTWKTDENGNAFWGSYFGDNFIGAVRDFEDR
jgi:hypothetical protein